MACPNYDSCQLIHVEDFLESLSRRQEYIQRYCIDEGQNWQNCRRFLTYRALHFCPDFVLPDTSQTTEEIIDDFDNGKN
jgi:hypothetical protein